MPNIDPARHRVCFHGDLDRIGVLRGLRRIWGVPEKHAGNPLIRPDTMVEEPSTGVHTSVVWNSDAHEFQAWYNVGLREPLDGCISPLAYATSTEGIRWKKPEIGLYEYRGSIANNLVYAPEGSGKAVSGPGILYDDQDTDGSRRYKMFYCTQRWNPDTGTKSMSDCCAAFSDDGIHWRHYEENPVVPGVVSDCKHSIIRDPERDGYICFVRLRTNEGCELLYRHGQKLGADAVRCVGRIESPDFIRWTEPELIIRPGRWSLSGDQYYGLTVFPYEGAFLGLLEVYHRDAPNYGYLETKLVFSDDTIHWRPAGEGMFLRVGQRGSWDAGRAGGPPCQVVLEDRILFYYTGNGWSHGGGGPKVEGPTGHLGLATLRRDGFAYVEPYQEDGTFRTHAFRAAGGLLHVNADASEGCVTGAVLDESEAEVTGYSHDECVAAGDDDVDQVIRWRGQEHLPGGKGLKIEFRLVDAALYSFWVA